jgi:hypothetical protein
VDSIQGEWLAKVKKFSHIVNQYYFASSIKLWLAVTVLTSGGVKFNKFQSNKVCSKVQANILLFKYFK